MEKHEKIREIKSRACNKRKKIISRGLGRSRHTEEGCEVIGSSD